MMSRAWMVVVGGLLAAGCQRDNEKPLTREEASQAVSEAAADGQAASLSAGTIELATSFTIGAAARDAAGEIRTFVESQMPCAGTVLVENKLTIEYGKKPGNCTYRGQTFSGTHIITVDTTNADQAIVNHEWLGLSNQRVQVDGTARVTWDSHLKSRRIEHSLSWTRLRDNRTAKGSGDRTQTPLTGGLDEGLRVDGQRTWNAPGGTWRLTIEGIEARWADPVPQAGTYTLTSPSLREMTLTFTRLDSNTIQVNVASEETSFDVKVNSIGDVDS